jgi:hypothetical protein
MHKARYNSLCLDLSLQPTGPLLIKSGQFAADPSLPDMQFVRTFRAGAGETIYIPGSSLKGVVRSFVEKALRTLDANCPPGPADDKSWRWACASFEAKKEERKDKSKWNCPQFLNELAEERHKELQSCEIYRYSCGACRTFGHTRLRGRASFTDLYPESDVKTETRYGVSHFAPYSRCRSGAFRNGSCGSWQFLWPACVRELRTLAAWPGRRSYRGHEPGSAKARLWEEPRFWTCATTGQASHDRRGCSSRTVDRDPWPSELR